MRINLFFTVIGLFVCSFFAEAQNVYQFYLYSYDHAIFNPAAAGAENKHVFGLNGLLSYNKEAMKDKTMPFTGMLSYNGNFSSFNSGIGAFAINDQFGTATTSKIGLSYNYKLNFNKLSSVRIGVRPTLTRLTIDFSKYRYLIEEDDLLVYPDEKESDIAADFDLGVWVEVNKFYFGATFNNVIDHHFSLTIDNKIYDYYGERSLTLIAGRKIKFAKIHIDPSLTYLKNSDYYNFRISNNFTLHRIIIGGTFIVDDYDYDVALNSGINIANKIELVGLIFARRRQLNRNQDHHYFEGSIRVKI